MTLENKDIVATPTAVFPRMVVFSPDGPQGAELKLALDSEEQQEALHTIFDRLKEEGKDLNVKNLQPLVEEAGLKRADT
jgi:hypothetical protein